jgi:hypothetical protein
MVDQAFREYRSNLEITDRQETLVSQRRAGVVRSLRKELKLHPSESLLIGSYDRHTLTRYLHEGDVDVMVILNYGAHRDWDSPAGTVAALDRFKRILDTAYPGTTTYRDRNCITMSFSEFRLDVVPAFAIEGGSCHIPDSVRRIWVSTNPVEFASQTSAANARMEGSLVPLIKMVKGWNRDKGWPIRSFHLECMMLGRYNTYTKGYTYPSMLKFFFHDLPGLLAVPAYDPVKGDRVDTYLDDRDTRSATIAKARKAAADSAEAYADQDRYPSVAIKEWRALLGEFFPAYG